MKRDIKLPDRPGVMFGTLNGLLILKLGLVVCAIGMAFGWMQYRQTKRLPAHQAMLDVSATIWETCKTYVLQQGKFLAGLWILIALCMLYYFGVLSQMEATSIIVILLCSIAGILGPMGWPGSGSDQHGRQFAPSRP